MVRLDTVSLKKKEEEKKRVYPEVAVQTTTTNAHMEVCLKSRCACNHAERELEARMLGVKMIICLFLVCRCLSRRFAGTLAEGRAAAQTSCLSLFA